MINLKRPINDPSNFHTLFMEAGLILSLSIVLVLFKIPFNPKTKPMVITQPNQVVTMEDIVKTKQDEIPPSPPAPEIPVAVPNDQIIEDAPVNLNAELNINAELPLPAVPPSSKDEEKNNDLANKIFVAVEHMPILIGGINELERKIVYPKLAREAGIEGRVYVEFVIDRQGNVLHPKVVRGIGGGCDEEAIRIVKTAKFQPGMQRGRPVNVRYTLSILFKLVDH